MTFGHRSLVAAIVALVLTLPGFLGTAGAVRNDIDGDDYEGQRTVPKWDIDVYSFHLKVNDRVDFRVEVVNGTRVTVYLFDMRYYDQAVNNLSFEVFSCCKKVDVATFESSFRAKKEGDYGILVTVTNPNEGASTYRLTVVIDRAGTIDEMTMLALGVTVVALVLVVALVWFNRTGAARERFDSRKKLRREQERERKRAKRRTDR